MKIAPAAVTPPAPLTAKTQNPHELNPAKQAKAADPAVKGAAFGALVSELAHARNAARFAARHGEPAPVETPPPVVEPAPAEEETAAAPPAVLPESTEIKETTEATAALLLLSGESVDLTV